MSTNTHTPGGEHRETPVEVACARHLVVELHATGADRQVEVARARLIFADDEAIYMTAPRMRDGSPPEWRVGRALRGYFSINDTRFGFDTSIVKARCIVQLNPQKKVVGASIARPPKVLDEQRREHFRVNTLHEEVRVDLHPALAGEGFACPIDAKPVRVTLINLSVGGAAVRLDVESARGIGDSSLAFCEIRLDHDDGPVEALLEVRQRRVISDGSAVRLGLQFVSWPDRRTWQHNQERLQKFISDLQREQIRRARQRGAA